MQLADNELPVKSNDTAGRGLQEECSENDGILQIDCGKIVFQARCQMPKSTVVMRSLASLMTDIERGVLEIDPEYQREVVWAADRMVGLINSLIGFEALLRTFSLKVTNSSTENFYVPPIILNKKVRAETGDNSALFVFRCVDGKQRLSSVRAFILGKIPCHDSWGEKWWFCDTAVRRRRHVLDTDFKNMFLAKELTSYEFSDLSSGQEEDLFARVQMGVQLSSAEKMRASTGSWQEFARLFVDDFPIVYALMKDRTRAKDFQLTLCCFNQITEVLRCSITNTNPVLKTNHSLVSRLLANKDELNDGAKSHLAKIWNKLTDLIKQNAAIFTNENVYLRGVRTFAPLEMVAVTVLVSMYSETRSDQDLLHHIKALRIFLRERFTDLRLNVQCWRPVWDFLQSLQSLELRRPVPQPSAVFLSNSPSSYTCSGSHTPVPNNEDWANSDLIPGSRVHKRQRRGVESKDTKPNSEIGRAEIGNYTYESNTNTTIVDPIYALRAPIDRDMKSKSDHTIPRSARDNFSTMSSLPRVEASIHTTSMSQKAPGSVARIPFVPDFSPLASHIGACAATTNSNSVDTNSPAKMIPLLQSQSKEGTRFNTSLPHGSSDGLETSDIMRAQKDSPSSLNHHRQTILSTTIPWKGLQCHGKSTESQFGHDAFVPFSASEQRTGMVPYSPQCTTLAHSFCSTASSSTMFQDCNSSKSDEDIRKKAFPPASVKIIEVIDLTSEPEHE